MLRTFKRRTQWIFLARFPDTTVEQARRRTG
jgi:hypothetical protein